jgi:chromosome segregation ATPase
MKIIPIEIPLKDLDEKLTKIQDLVDSKRKLLDTKHKKIENISKQNKFLTSVNEDYKKFYGQLVRQKEEQMMALNMLNKYLEDLNASNSLSNANLKDAKFEQKKILGEMDYIKKSLDNMIQSTNENSNVLY